MTSPIVSIVVPVYNAEAYVRVAIESALAQSFTEIEVIAVDDGSTDESASIVRSFSDDRLIYVRQQNAGQSAAINRGVRESHGHYIKILDADDWIGPDHVERQLGAIENRPRSVASCQWGYFREDFQKPLVRNEFTNQSYGDPMDWIVDSLTKDEGMMGGWMWLIPRRVWDKCGGYDERLSLNNDFHFSIALLLHCESVEFAKGAIYSYRKGVTQALSGSFSRGALESALLTTELGTRMLLERRDTPAVRRICADRFQQWLFQVYPHFPDLVQQAEYRISALGGSDLKLGGGVVLRCLMPLFGWKGVRSLQNVSQKLPWRVIQKWKTRKRLSELP